VLTADDIGHRVVVRHRAAGGSTDVLGELVAFDENDLVVRTEAGQEHRIARADVVAGKPVGPRPARYSEIIELERVADRAWPAPVVEHLGQWRLRYADGWTNRANSALPLGHADRPLDEAVRACARFYAERAAPAKITVPLPVRRDVARHLVATGWVAQPLVLVQTARLDAWPSPGPIRIALVQRPSSGLLGLLTARKQDPNARQELPPAARHVLFGVDAVRFAQAVDDDGRAIAGARGALVDGWLHIGLVEVTPRARRQGLARAVSASLGEWARGLGATRAVLQVEESNDPAVRLYASMGFLTHHTYVTYRLPA
jgi:GNAT superfamily N-acetyltransferase